MHSFSRTVYVYILSNRNFIACTFSCRIRGQENKFGSYMRTWSSWKMPKGSYNHEEEVRGSTCQHGKC
jgi:hypothetical protein